ncbi:MAG: hypothetical protein GX651_07600 [Methanomicrobiales archaeon]|nr:hypothetical protein [Methanomicrobiales archaeon]
MNAALVQFKKEVINFYVIAILNIVFSALAIAFGISSIVSAVFGNAPDGGLPALRIVSGALAMICFGLGLSWLLSTVEIFDGIDSIRDILCQKDHELSDDRATCLIIRMLAYYRDNRKTIGTMILVCTLGGFGFFILGIMTGLQAVSVFYGGISVTLDALIVIPAMLLTLGIAFVSLLSSYYFSRFSRVWDERLHEIDASECALKEKLGEEQ